LNRIAPPAKADSLADPETKDQSDDQTRDGDSDVETSKQEIGVLTPPCSVSSLKVVLEEPGDVDAESGIRQVVVSGPRECSGESDGWIECLEQTSSRTPEVSVELGELLGVQFDGERSSELGQKLFTAEPDGGQHRTDQEAVREDWIQDEHIVRPECTEEDGARVNAVGILTHHESLVIPSTESGVVVKPLEHQLEHDAVDETIDHSRQYVTPEHRARRQSSVMSVFEIVSKVASHLLECTTQHNNDELRHRFSGEPQTGQKLPNDVQLNTSIGYTLDDNPWDGENSPDNGDSDDGPPRCLSRPSFASDDRNGESSSKNNSVPPLGYILVSLHQSSVSVVEAVKGGSSLDQVDEQSVESLLEWSPISDEDIQDRKSVVYEVRPGLYVIILSMDKGSSSRRKDWQ
jgi:hypothetical protein